MKKIKIEIPEDFAAFCEEQELSPNEVLRGFIADLCELRQPGFMTNGSDERLYAQSWFVRASYNLRGQ